MEARRLIANVSYDPGQLKALGKAFDDAWDRLSPNVSNRGEAEAEIVLGLAKNGNCDPQWLADTAVQTMLAAPQKLRP
jgi:hypothetical protein